MKNPKSVLCIIPARGGSRRIPGKNNRLLNGIPLIAHSIQQALKSQFIHRTIVSTDSLSIAEVAKEYGAEVIMRPVSISGDTNSSEEALLHVINTLQLTDKYEPDIVVFLQCTSPIREPGDIDGAIKKLIDSNADSLLSVVKFNQFIWSCEDGNLNAINYDYRNRPRTQDVSMQYLENGSMYVFRTNVLLSTNNRLGGKITSYVMSDRCGIDIDEELDFFLCEKTMKWAENR